MSRRPLMANLAAILTVCAFMPIPAEAMAQGRTSRQAAREARAQISGPEAIATAQAALTELGLNCQVNNAAGLGATADNASIIEAACATGPGYLLVTSTPPTAVNCIAMAESARRAQAEDPKADPGLLCSLPENDNLMPVLTAYAATAGIQCQVDEGIWQGRTPAGSERYEIGCNGADGYWIEVAPNGSIASTIDCLEVTRAGQTCQFTTKDEQLASVRAMVQGTSAPTCDIQEAVSRGSNANGRFYEVKCGADAGYIFRTNAAGAFEQAFACADATHIDGGCTLSDASASIAAAAQARQQRVAALGFPCAVTQEVKLGQESGGQMREVYEFECSDRPLGVAAFLPTDGTDDGAVAMDCLSLRTRGLTCRFTSEQTILDTMTNMFRAVDVDCVVTAYSAIGPMEDEDGEIMEVKCANGEGRVANFLADRSRIYDRALTCAQAAARDYICEL